MNFTPKLPLHATGAQSDLHVENVDVVSHQGHVGAITIPDAHLLFSGDFEKSGNDLIISDREHREVVHDYFRGEKRPTLVSPEGAPLDSKVIEALSGHTAYAQAGTAPAAKVIGHVVKMTGSASIVRNGVTIDLNNGDNVYQNDVVQTGSGSTLGLVLNDGTTFNMTANARLMLNDLVYDPNSTSNTALYTLVEGATSFIAGQVAKTGDMKVATPVAAIGIRGTAVNLDISSTDGTVSISVIDQQDGQVHAVQVFNNAGNLIGTVTSNGTSLTLTPTANFNVIAQESNKTPAQVQQEFNAFQQVLSTYDIGKQLFPSLPQHTENTNPNGNPSPNTTNYASGSTPIVPSNTPVTTLGPVGGNTKNPITTAIADAIAGNTTPVSTATTSTSSTSSSQPQPATIVVVSDNDNIVPQQVQVPPISIPFVVTPSPVNLISTGSGEHFGPVMSADGRFVTYDPDGAIFLFDRQSNTTITIASPANGFTYSAPSISSDGHYIVYQGSNGTQSFVFIYDNDPSDAQYQQTTELVAGSSPVISGNGSEIVVENGGSSIGVFDLQGHVVANITPSTIGISGTIWKPAISADGNVITFWSSHSTAAGGSGQLFTYNLSTGTVTAIASTDSGAGTDAASISADGKLVVFQSDASNLFASQGQHTTEIFLYDLTTGQIVFSTANAAGASYNPVISPDGHFIIFSSTAQFTSVSTNGVAEVYVVSVTDPSNPVYQLVSASTDGSAANAASDLGSSISAGGLFVAFGSNASNLTATSTSGGIFFVDPSSGRTAVIQENTSSPSQLSASGVIEITGGNSSEQLLVSQDPTAIGSLNAIIGTDGNIHWTYQAAQSAFASLQSGQISSENFTITLVSDSGSTAIPVQVSVYDANQPAIVVPPTVTLSGSGGITNQAMQAISGNVAAGEAAVGATVYLYDNGNAKPIGTAIVQTDGTWSTSVTFSGDGAHSVVAKDTDVAGNTGVSYPLSFTLDTIPPTVTISSSGGLTNQATQTISGNLAAGEAAIGATVYLYDNGGATPIGTATVGNGGSWSTTVTFSGDGTHSIVAEDTDAAGNIGISVTPVVFTLDTVPPTVTISSSGGLTNQAGQTISGNVVANEAAVGATVYLYDNGNTTPIGTATVGAGGNWSTTVTLSGDGAHSIVAQDTDAAGNIGISATPVVFTLDTVPPTVTISSSGGLTNQAAQTISGNVAAGEAAIGASVYLYDNGGTTPIGTATVGEGGSWSTTVTLSGDGAHSIVAQDTDVLGNIGTGATPVVFTLDTTAPTVTTLTDLTSNGSDLDAGQTVTFTLAASETLTIATGAALTLSNGATAAYNSSTGKFVYTVAAGHDTSDLNVTGYSGSITDAAGNALVAGGVALDTHVQLDTTAPVVAINPTGGNTNQSAQPISGTVDIGDAGATVDIYDNGGTTPIATTVVQSDGTWSKSVTLVSGTNLLTAQVTDGAGNIGTSNTVSFTLNAVGPTGGTPVLAPSSDSGVSNSDDITNVTAPTFTVALGATVVAGDTVQLLLNGSPLAHPVVYTVTSTDIINGIVSLTVTAGDLGSDGSKSISAELSDSFGNSNDTGALVITLDTTAPSAPTVSHLADPSNGSFDAGFTVTTGAVVTVTENGTALTAGQLAADFTKSTAGGLDTYTAKSNAFVGTETIAVLATLTDAAGNVSNAGTLTLNPLDTTAPSAPTVSHLADPSNGSFDAGFTVTTGAVVTVTENGTALTAGQLAADFTKSTAGGLDTYTAKSNAFVGTETIAVSATLTDAAGNISNAGTLTLNPLDTTAPSAPTVSHLADPSNGSFDAGFTVTTGAVVTVTENGTALTAGQLAADFTKSTAGGLDTYTAKSNAFVGTETIAVSATLTDAAGNISNAGTLTLNPLDTTAPVVAINPTGGNTNQSAQPISGTVDIGDAGATVDIYDNGGTTPIATTVVQSDGTWSKSVTLVSGTNLLTAQVTDGAGNIGTSNTVSFTLNAVGPTGGTPVLAPSSDSGVSNSDDITNVTAPTFTVALGATVVAGDTVQLLLNGSPLAHPVVYTVTSTDIINGIVSLTVTAGDLGSDGSKSISAELSDSFGNSNDTGALVITLDTTAPSAPTVSHLADPSNGSFDAGFTVTTGAVVTVTENGTALTAGQLAADFTKSTAGGLDTYTAKSNAFVGTETIAVSATLTDAAGNVSNAGTLTLNPLDTTAPSAPTVSHLADTSNGSFDAGFTVTTGAVVTVTENGTALTAGQLAADFTKSTAGGLDTYTAKSNAFVGTETIAVSATLTDAAGNISNAGTLTLNPLDTTAPSAPTVSHLADPSNGSFDAGFTVTTGAVVTVTENGTALTAGQLAADFTKSTAGGLDTYTAKSNAFVGTETIAVSATLTDAAGNVSNAGTLTLNPLDTTAPSAPTVSHLADPSNGSFDAGFTVTTGAVVTVTENGTALTAGQLAADFTKSTAGGLDTYTAKSNAFVGTETIAVSATLTDAAGNVSNAGTLTLNPLDTTAPSAPTVSHLADPSNGSFDAGFTVTTGAVVTVTENGTALTAGQLAADFTKSTAGGLDTYTAKSNAFVGTETIAVSATLTDAAGNISNAGTLTLNPLDTTAPVVAINPTGGNTNQSAQPISGTVDIGDAGATVDIYDNGGTTPIATTVVQSDGTWSKSVTLVSGTNLLTAQVTDGAGNIGTSNTVSFTLNAVGPTGGTPVLAPSSDSGVSNSDDITNVTAPTFTVALGATVVAGDTVQLLLNGSPLAHPVVYTVTSTDIINGIVSLTVTAGDLGSDGSKSISAELSDSFGNSNDTGALVITLDTTAPSAPTVSHLADPSNGSFDAGFTVTTGAVVTVTENGTALTAGQLAADFTKSTAGGLDTYTAKSNAFVGTETIAVSATLTDAAGNVSNAGTLTLNPLDTTAPSAPTVSHLADPSNGSFDAGFTVTTGAVVTVTENGTALTAGQLAADFTKSTAGGLDTYTAKSNAFVGTETIAVSATLTDAAGNISNAGTLTLNPLDTTAPVVAINPTGGNTNQSAQPISGTVDIGDAGATVDIYDNGGTTPIATTVVQSDGTWSKSVTLVSGTNLLTAQVTDGAGNIGTSNTVSFTLPSFTIQWVGPNGGNWGTAANWSPTALPSSTDDVLIGIPDSVTFSTGSSTIDKLYSATGSLLTVSNGAFTVNNTSNLQGSLALSGGTFTSTAQMTVAGTTLLTGGTETGAGTTFADGVTTLFNGFSQTVTLDGGHILQLGGAGSVADTTTALSGETLNLNNGAQLIIASSATLTDQTTTGNTTALTIGGSGAAAVTNDGTYTKTGNGTTVVNVTFSNSGTLSNPVHVNIQNGTLDLAGGGTDSWVTYSGAGTIQFGNGTRTLDANSSITANAAFSGGTTTINGTYSAASTNVSGGIANLPIATASLGAVTVSGGALNLDNLSTAMASASSLTQSAGTLTGIGTLTVAGTSLLTGGTETGAGTTFADGVTTLFNGFSQTVTLDGGHILQLGGAGSVADTTTALSGETLNLNNGAQLIIASSATLTDQTTTGNTTALTIGGSGAAAVTNDGTYTKTGNGTTVVNVTFSNSGTLSNPVHVNIQNGTLDLAGGGTDSWVTYSGAGTIQFGNGTRTLDANSSITANAAFSGGTTTINGTYSAASTNVSGGTANLLIATASLGAETVSGGTLNLDNLSTAMASASSLTQSAGILTGTGTLTVAGTSLLTGGTETGAGTTFADGVTTLFNGFSQTVTLDGGHILQLGGAGSVADTTTALNGETLNLNNGAQLIIASSATLTDQTTTGNTTALTIGGSGAAAVTNDGTYTKTGNGTTVVNVTFSNSGMVNVEQGTLQLVGMLTDLAGGSLFVENATLELGVVSEGADVGFGGTGGLLKLDSTVSNSLSAAISATSTGGASTTIHSAGSVTSTAADAIDVTSAGGSISLTSAGTVTGALNGLFIAQNGTGDITVTANGTVTGQSGRGIFAEDNNTAIGNILINGSGSVTGIGTPYSGIVAQNLDSTNNGNVTVSQTGSISGGYDGIRAQTNGNGTVTVTTGASANITGGSRYGIEALANGQGSISVITATGDVITSASVGIDAYNQAGLIPQSGGVTTSSISVTASGTIDSGTLLTGSGSRPAGILAGYRGGTSNTPNSAVYGNVTVNNLANINAAGGDGIRAYNYGNGNITVNDQSNATIVANDVFGISANSYGSGTTSVTTVASDTITSGSSGISAINLASATGTGSSVSVTAHGTIHSGTHITPGGSQPQGISAGYYPGNVGVSNINVSGTVLLDNFANVTADAGWGLDAFNYGNGSVTLTDEAGTVVSGAQYGIGAYSNSSGVGSSGSVTVNVGQNAQITAGTFNGLAGIQSSETNAGNISITTSTGDAITSGGFGIQAGNSSTASATSQISITTLGGSISSGFGSNGGLPAGISAGYNPGNQGLANSNVLGNVIIDDAANITAASGFGINLFNFSAGYLQATIEAATTISAPATGINAFAQGGGNVSITNNGALFTSIGSGISVGTGNGLATTGNGVISVGNTGTISAPGAGTGSVIQINNDSAQGATFTNSGTVAATLSSNTAALGSGSNLNVVLGVNNGNNSTNTGGITVTNTNTGIMSGNVSLATSSFSVPTATFNNAGTWNTNGSNWFGASVNSIGNSGTINMAAIAGFYDAAGGTFTLNNTNAVNVVAHSSAYIGGTVTGSGTVTINDRSELELGGSVQAGQTISFASGATGVLTLDNPQSFSGTIANLAIGDTIDFLGGSIVTAASINTTELSVTINGLAQNYTVLNPQSGTIFNVLSADKIVLAPSSFVTEANFSTPFFDTPSVGTFYIFSNDAIVASGTTIGLNIASTDSTPGQFITVNFNQTSSIAETGAGVTAANVATSGSNIAFVSAGNISSSSSTGIGINTSSGAGSTDIIDYANVTGGQYAIDAHTTTGALNIVIGSGATITSSATVSTSYGIYASTTSSAVVTTTTGTTIDSGSAGILAQDQGVAGTGNSISVFNSGTINSGQAPGAQLSSVDVPSNTVKGAAGIRVGIQNGTVGGQNPAIIGDVSVENLGNITATAGSGIYAFDFGSGNVAVSNNATITANAAGLTTQGTGFVQYGIFAFNYGKGSTTVTTGFGSSIASGATGINSANQASSIAAGSGSTVTVIAAGAISSGTSPNNSGSAPSGIQAGYDPGGLNVFNTAVSGDVLVNDSANIAAAAGEGINAYNYAAGNVTVNLGYGVTIQTVTSGTQPSGWAPYGIGAFNYGTGNVVVTTSGQDVITSGSTGINASNQATALSAGSLVEVTAAGSIHSGTLLTNSGSQPSGISAGYYGSNGTPNVNINGTVIVNNSANITADAGIGLNAYNYGNGNVTVYDASGTTVTGASNGIEASTGGGASGSTVTGNVAINVYANATVTGTGNIGAFALSTDTGNISVITSPGDVINAGSAGIDAVNEAIATLATSSIVVTAAGTVNSGTTLTGTGSQPGGIIAGYLGGGVIPTVFPLTALLGDVIVTSSANINAAGGDGIRAFTYGIGDVEVNVLAGTITALDVGSKTPGYGVGISMSNYGSGNITVSTSASAIINSGASGITAVNKAPSSGAFAVPASSEISVLAYGIITSGTIPTQAGAVYDVTPNDPPALIESLSNDTGTSPSDKVTSNDTVTGVGIPNTVVHFTIDGTSIVPTVTANALGAWSFTPSGLGDGSHTIVASQTDSSNNTGSASLTFTLDTTAPAVAITGPGGSTAVATQLISGTVGVADAGATVVVLDGATTVGTATVQSNGSWSATVPLANGSNSLTAQVADAAGNVGTSAAIIYTLTTTGPSVVESLSNDTGASASDKITSNASITGLGLANTVVHFTVDGNAAAATVTANAQGVWSFTPTGLADGVHTIVASQTDGSNNTGSAFLTFTLDTAAPVVTISGVNGSVSPGATETVTGTVDVADAGATVQIFDGTTAVGTATVQGNGGWSAVVPLASGVNNLKAVVTDTAGNVGINDPAAGILATYNPDNADTPDSNVHGNVLVDDYASISAATGTDGIRGVNYGTGTITITVEASAAVDAGRYGIGAFSYDGGNVSISNSGSVESGIAIDATTTGAATVTIDNLGYLGGNVDAYNATFTNEQQGDWSINGASVFADTSTLDNIGTIESNGTSSLTGLASITNTGTVDIDSGSLKIAGPVTGGGAAVIYGATLEYGAASDAHVQFDTAPATPGTLILDDVAHFSGSVTGFTFGDTIDLVGISPTNVTVSNAGSLHVNYGSGSVALLGNYDPTGFSVVADGHNGTDVAWNHQAPVIVTNQFSIVQNSNGTTTIDGLQITDTDPLVSTETFNVTATTGQAALGSSVSPSTSSGSLSAIDGTLAAGVTYNPGSTPPATDKVTLTVADSFGATDTVNFVFNQAGSGPNVTLQGTPGNDVIFATHSSDTLTGGGGQDQFVFAPSSNPSVLHTITDFVEGIDKIDLRQFSNISSTSLPTETQVGNDTLMTLDNNDTLLLKNVVASNLHAADFIVHA